MLLTAANLSFAYPSSRASRSDVRGDATGRAGVLDGVSLDIDRGALVAVLGPNGSGKTTLLKLLSGALAPSGGDVRLDGRPVRTFTRRDLARRIAVVPQETHLTFDYTVLEIVLMGRYPWMRAFQIEGPTDLASAFDALEATGAGHLARRGYLTLSGGEKQRVIIASVLAQLDARSAGSTHHASGARGSLLLLDEPTASLDLKYQLEVAALVRRLHDERGITVVLSTHDLRLASRLCTRVVLLSRGRVLADGRPDAMLSPQLVGALYDIGADAAAFLLH